MKSVQLGQVRQALALDEFDALAAQRRMAPQPRALRRSRTRPGQPRQASVLVLLYPSSDELSFALIQRTLNPQDVHSGQISLPGGSLEPGETPVEAALREAEEELGIRERVEILGNLTCLYIPPSDFEVRPTVGFVPHHPVWEPDRSEVAEVLECPLAWLLDDALKVVEDWERDGQIVQVPWYNVHERKVWGATAIILSELEHRLRQVLGGMDV